MARGELLLLLLLGSAGLSLTRLCPHSFLGYVDKLGVAYEAPTVATGFGAYLAQVRLRGGVVLVVCSEPETMNCPDSNSR